ncbi:MAG: hypothetical protein FWH04_01190 [Oscillospiraceae bacterium]|nr:hypothetical protein [Oscillospiraceae bacterium]
MLSLTLILSLLCSMLPSKATDPLTYDGYIEITSITISTTYTYDKNERNCFEGYHEISRRLYK